MKFYIFKHLQFHCLERLKNVNIKDIKNDFISLKKISKQEDVNIPKNTLILKNY